MESKAKFLGVSQDHWLLVGSFFLVWFLLFGGVRLSFIPMVPLVAPMFGSNEEAVASFVRLTPWWAFAPFAAAISLVSYYAFGKRRKAPRNHVSDSLN